MLSITKRYTFEASHFLPNHKGACRNIHGHSYKVEITVSGEKNNDDKSNEYGMIIDFKELKRIIELEIGKYDHQSLNQFFENPTAENMVEKMFKDIERHFKNNGKVIIEEVKLWETEDSYATYRRD